MKKFVLDISEIDRSDFEACKLMPDKIECIRGGFRKQFDILMEEIPEESIAHARAYYTDKYGETFDDKPIGFDIFDLPVGAKLERVE